ncbi:hypothetical protein G7Y89_g6898 [Cudoniella acicularis]|uniref:Heterokaryon incompatibility domain-containing protein n=1 Tax=Cudoniella acicularis TaxID=354080 RepID=A0A8H4W2K6_9HELO|nr:hypothetical protein G7Y89_g6898 [Cudoniella acicularis]
MSEGYTEGGVPYGALSYTWETLEKEAKIIVNGSTMHIIEQLRFEDRDRILWIDAICIDQDNNEERKHQVQQMGSIYKEAEEVVVWLGSGTNETDLIMDSMKQLHENNVKVERDWRLSAQLWMHTRSDTNPRLGDIYVDQSARWREGMNLILKRSWFRRIWILQEIANARVATILCGQKSVSTRTFAQVPSLIGLQPYPYCQAILDIMPGLAEKESWWSHKRNLHTLLLKFRENEATDERDIIYALLGISSDVYKNNIFRIIRNPYSRLSEMPFYSYYRTLYRTMHKQGEEEMVILLLGTDRVDINSKGRENETSLSLAAKNGHEAIVRLLLEKGAKLDSKDSKGQTPLASAVKNGREAIFQLLLEKGANLKAKAELDSKDNRGQTLLSCASENGYEAIVRLLLEKGADIETRDNEGQTPLASAVKNGHEAIVQLLLEKGADLNARNHSGQTPLSQAAPYYTIVLLLLEKGADIETRDNKGLTPLGFVAETGNKVAVQLLPEKGADLSGQTPLAFAATNGYRAMVQMLLDLGANVELMDFTARQTPLSRAARYGHEAIVQLLLEQGARLELKNSGGQTPLSLAARHRYKAVVRLLLERGAKLEEKNSEGQTPLFLAARHGYETVVRLVIEHGAELKAEDSREEAQKAH